MQKIKNNNFITHHSPHNPSLPFASGEDAPFSSPAWQGELVERLFKEIEGLKKEIKEIKQFFHIDDKPPKIINIRHLAKQEAEKFIRRGK